MIKKRYVISDASKLLTIEPHVLRNWEYELKLIIPRNEHGHRYYTEELISNFKIIKNLKDNGFPLKHIKLLLPTLNRINNLSSNELHILKDKLNSTVSNNELSACDDTYTINSNSLPKNTNIISKKTELTSPNEKNTSLQNTTSLQTNTNVTQLDKLEQFKYIVKETLVSVIQENYETFAKEISSYVSTNVAKEVNYHLMQQENRSEEYYKKLDIILKSTSRRPVRKNNYAQNKKRQFKLFPIH